MARTTVSMALRMLSVRTTHATAPECCRLACPSAATSRSA